MGEHRLIRRPAAQVQREDRSGTKSRVTRRKKASMASDPHFRAIVFNSTVPYGYKISWLANFFREPIFKHIASEYELTSHQYMVLFCLAHRSRLKSAEICSITGRPRNSVSRACIELEKRNFIGRRTDHKDRRQQPLYLTDKGRKIYAAMVPLFRERQERMVSVLSAAELKTLDVLLTKLVDRSDDWALVY